MNQKSYVLTLFALLAFTFSWAQTLGGTVIPNQAVATYNFAGEPQEPEVSNPVFTDVPSICSLEISPNGSVAIPAQQVSSFVGSTIYLPYTLSNTGNGPQDYSLATLLDVASTVTPQEINIILDTNNNQIADSTEGVVTSLSAISFGESVSLLVEVILDTAPATFGQVYINLTGACSNDGSIQDSDNISQITVLEGGIQTLSKDAVPASESFVVAGDIISYSISFEVNEQALSNVLITDVIDVNLDAPSELVLTVNDIVMTGAANYDAATHMASAALASLAPNDRVELTITTTVSEDVLGAVVIRNQASVDFDGAPTQETNEVIHTTTSTCGLVITPDGTIASPAQQQNALPGQDVIFPYVLANIGNIISTYSLELETLGQSTLIPKAVRLYEDSNGNGQVDTGEVEVSSLTLAPDAEADLLVVVTLPENPEVNGDSFVNVVGICPDISARDDNNVSQVTIPLGGFASPQKSADPIAGTMLYPGVEVKYFITFTANGRDLNNVVVSDTLSEFLAAPSEFSTGTITDEATGLSTSVTGNYNADTHTLTWNLITVPPQMTVTLEFTTRVRTDVTEIPAGTTIANTASVSSDETPEASTNTTLHPLSPIAVLLRKTANPERVVIGETLVYTLEVINPDEGLDLKTLELTDDLPDVLRYQPGTSLITFPDGSKQKIEPEVNGQTLTWVLSGLKASERLSVVFATTVLPGAEDVEEIVNTAQVVASDVNGRAVADAAASVGTVVTEGALSAKAVLIGTVFVDYNLNGIYDHETDKPAENVRLYLSDGHSVLSDNRGRYTFLELEAGLESLKVDNTTLPARLFEKTNDEVKAGLWRVRLQEGLISRQDVPLLPPQAMLAIDQVLNVSMGSVTIQKSVLTNEGGYEVVLEIGSSQALNNLVIKDILPDHAHITGEVAGDFVATNDLRFEFGDIPAGYMTTIRYPIIFEGDIRDLLVAPLISWDVRP